MSEAAVILEPPLTLNQVMRADPTRTTMLRNSFAAQMTKRFVPLKGSIRGSIVGDDCFGIKQPVHKLVGLAAPTSGYRAFDFTTSAQKVDAFMEWLDEMSDLGVLEVSYAQGRRIIGHSHWMDLYIGSAYKKGLQRSSDELVKAGIKPSAFPALPVFAVDSLFNRPIHADRVALLYTRAFNELKGITKTMGQQVSRVLAQGIAEGRGPYYLARQINDRVSKIGLTRAKVLARTEIIRAHHVATINNYREAGVLGVRVMAEWSTAGDKRVCELCDVMEVGGKIYTLDEIEGLIPLHPLCLLDGQVKIYTSEGWKPVRDVKVGDLVLTHKKRFRKVIQLHHTPKQKPDAVRIFLAGKNNQQMSLSLTADHPVKIGHRWLEARRVKPGLKVYLLADKCVRCGEPIPYFKKYCSHSCLSKDVTDRQWANPEHRENISKKTSLQLKREYAMGIRDGDKITRKAHKRIREIVKEGTFHLCSPRMRERIRQTTNLPKHCKASSERMKKKNPMWDPEIRQRTTESFRRTLRLHPEKRVNARMAKYRKSGKKTWIEQRMSLLLDKMGVDYVFQYPILRYDVDFAIPALRIVIECDGAHWHKDKDKDARRQRRIEKEGWFVLRYSGAKINQCLDEIEEELGRVVGNHSGKYDFVQLEVKRVKKWKVDHPIKLYNLSVEEDESYVANGFVVHNCRCCALPANVGEKRRR